METFMKVSRAHIGFAEPRETRGVQQEFRRLKQTLMVLIQAQMARRYFERDASICLAIEMPALLDLPAYTEMVEEIARDFGIVLERELGYLPETPECFVRMILPEPKVMKDSNIIPLRPKVPLVEGVDIEEMLRRDLEGYQRRVYPL